MANGNTRPHEDAAAEIGAIMHEVSILGANDFEIPALRQILEELETSRLAPSEALRQAQEIRDRKQAYH